MPTPQKIDLSAGLDPSSPPIDLSAGVDPEPAPQMAEMRAGKPEPWLNQLEDDLTTGGNRTFIGRAMGHLQGRGDKGYSGMGQGPMGVKSVLASPVMGPVHALQGESEMLHGHPIKGFAHTLKGDLEAVQLPMAMMAGPEVEAADQAIPSTEHAASILNDIEKSARNVPVYMEETKPSLQRFSDYVKTGGKNTPVITKLARRINNVPPRPAPPTAPLTDVSRLLGGGTQEIPLGEVPTPGEMPGGLIDAERFPPQNVGEARVIRNNKGQILPRVLRKVEFPDESGKLPIARNPNNGQMLARTPTRRAWMAGDGKPVFDTPEFSGPGVLIRPRTFEPIARPMPDYDAPVNFPEARKFYTNVSRVTRRPGFIRRAIESPMNPSLRMNAGDVREALNSDLLDAANRVGRGADYSAAMREYANAKKLQKVRNIGVGLAAEEAARRTGLLGKAMHRAAQQ